MAPAASEKFSVKNRGMFSVIRGMGKPFLLLRMHLSQIFSSDFNLSGISKVILLLFSNVCKKLFWKNLKPLRKIPI